MAREAAKIEELREGAYTCWPGADGSVFEIEQLEKSTSGINRDRLCHRAMEPIMKTTDSASPETALPKSNRRRFLGTAAIGGSALLGSGLLSAINNGAKAAGKPIPIGGGVPLTGWAAADGIEFKRALEMSCEEINAMGGILGQPLEPHFEDTKEQGAANIIPAMQRLIDRHNVHAIVNGYNTGAVCAEYDVIADAGVLYIHHNTDITHYAKIKSNRERYFGIFMGDPAEYYYGPGLLVFLNNLVEKGVWKRPNNKIAVVTGSQNYSVVIADAIKSKAKDYGWEVSMFETVVVPISEWGPTLAKIRQDPPAIVAVTHWVPQDLAQFMLQFVPNPTNSLVYMQYGPSLAAFREIGKAATNGVLYSTVIASLQDEIGQDFNNRYKKKYGPSASPLVAAQVFDSAHYWAVAAALAGGSGGPGELEQNRKVADRLRTLIYRGTMGITHFNAEQGAIPYPDETKDPSLGMPHQYLQIQDYTTEPALIAPPPYETSKFKMPPWIKA
jgi:branched-chain amino acid transport system substrate-binding protein